MVSLPPNYPIKNAAAYYSSVRARKDGDVRRTVPR